MQVFDKEGNVVFDTSGDLTKSSIIVVEQITEILKNLLTSTTITTSAAEVDVSVYGVYKKEEVDKLLENYVSSTNAQDIVLAALGTLMAQGEVPNNAQIKTIQDNINTLSSNNIDFVKRVTNVESSIGSHSDSITKIESAISDIKSTDFVQTSDIATLKSDVSNLQKSSTSQDTKIAALENTTKDIQKDITDIKVQLGVLNNELTSIKEEVAKIASMDARLTSVESRISALEEK